MAGALGRYFFRHFGICWWYMETKWLGFSSQEGHIVQGSTSCYYASCILRLVLCSQQPRPEHSSQCRLPEKLFGRWKAQRRLLTSPWPQWWWCVQSWWLAFITCAPLQPSQPTSSTPYAKLVRHMLQAAKETCSVAQCNEEKWHLASATKTASARRNKEQLKVIHALPVLSLPYIILILCVYIWNVCLWNIFTASTRCTLLNVCPFLFLALFFFFVMLSSVSHLQESFDALSGICLPLWQSPWQLCMCFLGKADTATQIHCPSCNEDCSVEEMTKECAYLLVLESLIPDILQDNGSSLQKKKKENEWTLDLSNIKQSMAYN